MDFIARGMRFLFSFHSTWNSPLLRPNLACAATPGGAKKVPKLETGLEVQVPLFMKEGEIVRVNTQTAEVAGRA